MYTLCKIPNPTPNEATLREPVVAGRQADKPSVGKRMQSGLSDNWWINFEQRNQLQGTFAYGWTNCLLVRKCALISFVMTMYVCSQQ